MTDIDSRAKLWRQAQSSLRRFKRFQTLKETSIYSNLPHKHAAGVHGHALLNVYAYGRAEHDCQQSLQQMCSHAYHCKMQLRHLIHGGIGMLTSLLQRHMETLKLWQQDCARMHLHTPATERQTQVKMHVDACHGPDSANGRMSARHARTASVPTCQLTTTSPVCGWHAVMSTAALVSMRTADGVPGGQQLPPSSSTSEPVVPMMDVCGG